MKNFCQPKEIVKLVLTFSLGLTKVCVLALVKPKAKSRKSSMAEIENACIEWVDGLSVGRQRGLAWLIVAPRNKKYNAKEIFEKLGTKTQNQLLNRMDSWLEGHRSNVWYHGWNEEDFRKCFVFKYKEHRIYSFLCNPRTGNPEFQLCVMSSYTTKNEKAADPVEKNKMRLLAENSKVLLAAKKPEEDCNCHFKALLTIVK
jgi:hypothetical protein